MPKDNSDYIINIVIGVLIFMALIGTIGSSILDRTTDDTAVDTYTTADYLAIPFNLTLTNAAGVSLINVTNGTTELSAGNYTDYITDGIIQMNDNTSWSELNVEYTWNNETVGGVTATLLGLVVLLIVVGFIKTLTKKKQTR